LKTWQLLYDTKYVPDAGDLYLVAQNVSFDVGLNISSLRWELNLPDTSTSYPWKALPWPLRNDTQMNFIVSFDPSVPSDSAGSFNGFLPLKTQRVVVPLAKYSSSMPNFTWPDPILVEVAKQNSWRDALPLNNDNWMTPPLQVNGSSYSQPLENSSSIQIALPFMLVVVICNALKIIAVYYTLHESFTQHIVTQGDAIASFLERPDPTTFGYCSLDKKPMIESYSSIKPKDPDPWVFRRGSYGQFIHDRWMMKLFL
jgi:hypothetical protein